MNEKYKEIFNLPHHTSSKHPRMSKSDRAAQFAPYSALSGYEDAVEETARPTDGPIELDEYEKERINASLTAILSAPCGTRISIIFFRPDEKKYGGAFVTVTGEIGKFDEFSRKITLIGGTPISIDDIIEIHELNNK